MPFYVITDSFSALLVMSVAMHRAHTVSQAHVSRHACTHTHLVAEFPSLY